MTGGRLILWHALGGGTDAAFVGAAMRELLDILRNELPPLNLTAEPIEERHGAIRGAIVALDYGDLDGCIEAIRRDQERDRSRRIGLLVHCRPDHPAAIAARKRLPHAVWGISLAGSLSLAYADDNKHLLWHEALHLCGAQDHYDPATLRLTCKLPTCLMQYAPTATAIAARPFLCQRTKAILNACGTR